MRAHARNPRVFILSHYRGDKYLHEIHTAASLSSRNRDENRGGAERSGGIPLSLQNDTPLWFL